MKRILLVDDEKKIRTLYKKLLIDEGYEVIEAVNAREATDILLVNHIDLVLLDLNMPDITGDEMLDIVKIYDPKFKVIVISVCPIDEQQKRVPDAHDYFDKSHAADILLDKIKDTFEFDPNKVQISNN